MQRFSCLPTVCGCLPTLPLRISGISEPQLACLPESAANECRGTPRQFGRMPFDVRSCPMCRGGFARFGPRQKLLPASFRLSARAHFAKQGLTSDAGATEDGVVTSVEAAAMATTNSLYDSDFLLVAQDFVRRGRQYNVRPIPSDVGGGTTWNA